ncbi:site-2 protease family protein [Limnohabitans sp.]|uniref:site-2 protease family protein n=1 Tax=Limnohabitans sp. TaxID=1907725 RepID=UPI00286F7C1A|nr:site-2 protease family protein [Limnohabitans sp.]
MNFPDLIQTILIYGLPVIFAITLHEAAHGYVAHRFGDNTAWMMGRVTLNPVPHIDPMGTLLMPIVLFLATGGHFLFGYARPVPVNFSRLNHPKRDMIWVALAGPAANFVQAFLWAFVMYGLIAAGVQERFFIEVCKAGVKVNAVMFAFNLFPLPPLDGGRILVGLLPWKQAVWLSRIEPYGFYIVMALIVLKVVDTLWMAPIMTLTFELLSLMLSPFEFLLKP